MGLQIPPGNCSQVSEKAVVRQIPAEGRSDFKGIMQPEGIEVLEGHLLPDHIHMCLSVPPKFSIAFIIGFLKGKSAIRIHREILRVKRVKGLHFWSLPTACSSCVK